MEPIFKEEKETIILFDETDEPVSIYTFNKDLMKRLKEYAKEYPDEAQMKKK